MGEMFLIFISAILASMVEAKVPCRGPSQFAALAATRSRMPAAAKEASASKRLYVDQYARKKRVTVATIQDKFGASGDIECDGLFGQAQVTMKDNVVTTAGHAVHHPDCSVQDLSKCRFSVSINGSMKQYRIKRLVDSDYKCTDGPPPPKHDWAVLELEEAVPVRPYKIDRAATKALGRGSDVTSVGRSLDLVKPGASGEQITDHPRHYTDCRVDEVFTLWQGDDPDYLATNCGGAKLSSGGGLFKAESQEPTLVGIMVQSSPDHKSDFVPVAGRLASVLSAL